MKRNSYQRITRCGQRCLLSLLTLNGLSVAMAQQVEVAPLMRLASSRSASLVRGDDKSVGSNVVQAADPTSPSDVASPSDAEVQSRAPLSPDASRTNELSAASAASNPLSARCKLASRSSNSNKWLTRAIRRLFDSQRWSHQPAVGPIKPAGCQSECRLRGTADGSKGRAEQHGATLSQEFVRKEKRQLDRSVANQEIAQAEQQLAAQRQRVLTDVRAAYYRVLYAQQQITALEELNEIAQKAVVIAEQLLKAEEVAKTDLLQAEVEKQQAELQLATAQYTLQAAWSQLTAVIGQPMPLQNVAGDFFSAQRASILIKRSLG